MKDAWQRQQTMVMDDACGGYSIHEQYSVKKTHS